MQALPNEKPKWVQACYLPSQTKHVVRKIPKQSEERFAPCGFVSIAAKLFSHGRQFELYAGRKFEVVIARL